MPYTFFHPRQKKKKHREDLIHFSKIVLSFSSAAPRISESDILCFFLMCVCVFFLWKTRQERPFPSDRRLLTFQVAFPLKSQVCEKHLSTCDSKAKQGHVAELLGLTSTACYQCQRNFQLLALISSWCSYLHTSNFKKQ